MAARNPVPTMSFTLCHPRGLRRRSLLSCLVGAPFPVSPRLRGLGKLRDVLYAVNDVGDLAVCPEDRRVDGAPVALLETSSFLLRLANVVFLYRHRVRRTDLRARGSEKRPGCGLP